MKFRHYDTRLNEMRYSDRHNDEFYVEKLGIKYMYAIPRGESELETRYYKSYKVDASTGFIDIEGISIYTGDILEIHIQGCKQVQPYVVESIGGLFYENNREVYYRIGSMRIIGNIYESEIGDLK